MTAHGLAVIGRIEKDHIATSAHDLGQIVWPVVKEAMSRVLDRALRDREDCAGRGRLVSELKAVVRDASREVRATLLVDDDYHRRGSTWRVDGPPVMIVDVDVRDTMDDVVDAVIETVLGSAGNVVFMPPGTLRDQEQIVLLPRGGKGP